MAIVSMMLSVNGPGTVPLGAIIPVGNVGAWALPASGEIKDGFALCDGTAFPVGSHPSFAGNRPNLTDDRFLNGSTAVGGTGGTTSKTTTGIAASFNKNVLNSDQIAHNHELPFSVGTTSGGSGIIYGFASAATSGNGLYGNSASPGGTITAAIATIATTVSASYTTVSDSNTATVSWNPATVSTTVTQGTITDIRPQYFSVVYLMRVI